MELMREHEEISGPCCAHLHVDERKMWAEGQEDRLCIGIVWECRMCKMQFVPKSAIDALQARLTARDVQLDIAYKKVAELQARLDDAKNYVVDRDKLQELREENYRRNLATATSDALLAAANVTYKKSSDGLSSMWLSPSAARDAILSLNPASTAKRNELRELKVRIKEAEWFQSEFNEGLTVSIIGRKFDQRVEERATAIARLTKEIEEERP